MLLGDGTKRKRKAVSIQPTGGSPAYPSQQRGALTGIETALKALSQTDAYILTGFGGKTPQRLPTGYERALPPWESARLNRPKEPLAHISGQSGVSANQYISTFRNLQHSTRRTLKLFRHVLYAKSNS